MTDLEIDKALALAIGWRADQTYIHLYGTGMALSIVKPDTEYALRIFSHKDPAVIWPIAERFDCFPKHINSMWEIAYYGEIYRKDTPAKAVAMAVIGMKK
jgi:hypothetical protein